MHDRAWETGEQTALLLQAWFSYTLAPGESFSPLLPLAENGGSGGVWGRGERMRMFLKGRVEMGMFGAWSRVVVVFGDRVGWECLVFEGWGRVR